jgi:hypothetical protein
MRLLHDLAREHAGAIPLDLAVLACACAHAQALATLTRKGRDEGGLFCGDGTQTTKQYQAFDPDAGGNLNDGRQRAREAG